MMLKRSYRTADNAVGFLGRLVTKLHSSGVFSDADVLELLGYGWDKAE